MSSFEAIETPPPMTGPADEPALRLQLDESLASPPPLTPNADKDDTPQPPPPLKRPENRPN